MRSFLFIMVLAAGFLLGCENYQTVAAEAEFEQLKGHWEITAVFYGKLGQTDSVVTDVGQMVFGGGCNGEALSGIGGGCQSGNYFILPDRELPFTFWFAYPDKLWIQVPLTQGEDLAESPLLDVNGVFSYAIGENSASLFQQLDNRLRATEIRLQRK